MDFSWLTSIINNITASENIIEITVFVAFVAFLTGIIAGFVDSTVGGGGLIAFPVLSFFGIPAHNILATNKLQAILGTISSVYHFKKKGLIEFKTYFPCAFFLTLFFSIIGVFVLKNTSHSIVEKIVPIIIFGILIYKIIHFNHGMVKSHKSLLKNLLFILIFTPILGFYDGFFGPGVGTLWIFALITFAGMDSLHASANAKLLNLASNIGAMLVFIPSGMICYKLAIIMGMGQICGAKFGVHISVKKGAKLINVMFIIVASLLTIRLFVKFYL